MKITAIIPARGGSKTIPYKNMVPLKGYPLIAYAIAAAKLSSVINDIIVSTDNREIAEISQKYGATVPFLRPSEISQDHSTDMEFFEHYIDFCRNTKEELAEYLVHLRPNTPLREIKVLDEGIRNIISSPEATSLRSVQPISFVPHKVFKIEGMYLRSFFPDDPRKEYYNLPRQYFPQTYTPNGYVDVVRTSIIEKGTLHGDNMVGFVTPNVPDIDEPADLEYAKRELVDKRYREIIEWLDRQK